LPRSKRVRANDAFGRRCGDFGVHKRMVGLTPAAKSNAKRRSSAKSAPPAAPDVSFAPEPRHCDGRNPHAARGAVRR